MSNLADLEFLVLLAQKYTDVMIDTFDFRFVQSLRILCDIFLIIKQQLSLHGQCVREILLGYKGLDNSWHATDCDIIAKGTHHGLHLKRTEWFQSEQMFIKVINLRIAIAQCPQELLKVERHHLAILLVANAVRLNLMIINAHHRSGTNHIITPVELKGLEAGGTVGTILHLVKKNECFIRHELTGGVNQRDILNNGINPEAIVKYSAILWLQGEVDSHHMLIISLSKLHDGESLAHLPRTTYNQWQPFRIRLPVS